MDSWFTDRRLRDYGPGAATAPQPDAIRFLHTIYEGTGWMELCFIAGDPRTERCQRDEWYQWPADVERIERRLTMLTERYGNVYVSSTLYHQPVRSAAAALPSRVVFLDDAPTDPSLRYTMTVRTSERSQHAYYLLDQAVDPVTRRELQAAAAAALGADQSGADVEQIVRVPGTFNTKRAGRFPVRLEADSGPIYTVDTLRIAWPVVERLDAAAVDLDQTAVEYWLGNIAALLGADGLPRRLTAASQARRVLTGEITPVNSAGLLSTSDSRAFVARGLVLHGHLDAEIAALLLHLCDYGASARKGTAWLYQDIARLIAKERARYPHIVPTPTRSSTSRLAMRLPDMPRAKRGPGRPVALRMETYLAWLHERLDAGVIVFGSIRENAAALNVSPRTIERVERTAREAGLIRRGTSHDRQISWIELLPDPAATPATEPAAAGAQISSGQVPHKTQVIDRARMGEEHTARVASPTPLAAVPVGMPDLGKTGGGGGASAARVNPRPDAVNPPLDDPNPAMRPASIGVADGYHAAIEAVAAEHERISKKRVQTVLAAFFPFIRWSDAAYQQALTVRRREAQEARTCAWARGATPNELRSKASSLAGRQARALQAGHVTQAYAVGCEAVIIENEIERRIDRGEIRRSSSRNGLDRRRSARSAR